MEKIMEKGEGEGPGDADADGGGIPEQEEIHPGGPVINQENFQNEQHPLLNELILEHVFKYVGAGALAQARLVNTIWYDASLSHWNKLELPIILCLEDDPTHRIPTWKGYARDAIPMRHFMQSLETGGGGGGEGEEEEVPVVSRGLKQHTTFELRAQVAPQLDYNLLESFWNQVGDWMSKLTLWDFFFPDLELVGEVVLCRRTPNLESLDVLITMGKALVENNQVVEVQGEHVKLKTLKIGMLPAHHESTRGVSKVTFPFSWDDLLNYYPKLESLTLHTVTYETYMVKEVKPCLTAIKRLRREDGRKLASLKKLSWFDEDFFKSEWDQTFDIPGCLKLSSDILDLLKECNLALTSLGMNRPGIDYRHVIWKNERVFEALATYRTTLREFTLFQLGAGLQLEGLLPSDMTQLQYLCLVGTLRDMALLRNVPSTVHTLKISGRVNRLLFGFRDPLNAISKTNQEELTSLVRPSLRILCLFQVKDNGWTRGDITRLAGWMPNLTRLGMELTNEAFRAVCDSFPNLEQLRVYGEEVGDKGITGEMVVEIEGQDVVVYEQPNLASLRKLRSFVIDSRPGGGWGCANERITKVSVLHGFLKLPLLERLILRTYCLVTPEAKSLLEERIQFAKVTIF